MLTKITAAALSTVLSVTAAFPCSANGSGNKNTDVSNQLIADRLLP